MSMMRRSEVRSKFNIEGSTCGDCCASFCCPCCVELQSAKECKSRIGGGSGVNTQGYAPQTGMHTPLAPNGQPDMYQHQQGQQPVYHQQ
jgi:hypothetical protein